MLTLFFFFQAEDGIRDVAVTGVQTCALPISVQPGRCYGLCGRNGAGKTTTMKCLLNLLRPQQGSVRVFGMDPSKNEVEVKSRIAYVPDQVALYPWMSVREMLDYVASFWKQWNWKTD